MPTRRRGQPAHQVVDPVVSRTKFEREVGLVRAREAEYRRRGCIILDATFPSVELIFGLSKLRPSMLVFGARLDFRNYDAEPPSVQIVDPWAGRILRASELLTDLPLSTDPGRRLLQAWTPNDIPFLCMRGVREYHRNPGHTGDSWWLHRGRGEGTLSHLIEVLTTNGPEQIAGYDFRVLPQPRPDGLTEMRVWMAGFSFRSSRLRAASQPRPPVSAPQKASRAS